MTSNSEADYTAGYLEKRSHTWYGRRFLEVFSQALNEEVLGQGAELLRSRKVVDCMIQSGMMNARVYDERPSPHLVEVRVPQLSDEEWERAYERMAGSLLFLATMLSGELPVELEAALSSVDAGIFPRSLDEFTVKIDGQAGTISDPFVAGLIIRAAEKLDQDPFLLFLLRGRGREETLLEIRRHRDTARKALPVRSEQNESRKSLHTAKPLQQSLEHFWSLGCDLSHLTYRIRADELPASVLKWLDPLPLTGLEEYLDIAMEDAYERVTRLAQSFGLGMW